MNKGPVSEITDCSFSQRILFNCFLNNIIKIDEQYIQTSRNVTE